MAPGSTAFRAARHRHHAESAPLVAAFNDGQIGAEAVVAPGEFRLEAILGVQIQPFYPAVSGLNLRQQLRQLRIAGRTAHQAHLRGALEKALAFLLRHAPQHADDLVSRAPALRNVPRREKTFCAAFSRMLHVL